MRVRWTTLARWVGGGLALLVALQALPSLLRPPPPGPLAADIGLPRVRAAKPVAPPAGAVRVSPARALPARRRVDRRDRRRPTGRERPVEAEAAAPPAPPPVTAAPSPAPPPPPADGSVEFMPP